MTLPDERFPAAEDWLDLKLAAVKKSARIHEVQLCIPRQLPFMDRVVVYLLTVRRMGQVDEEVVYGEGVAFETAQGRNGSDCHSFVMDTSNPPDDQVAVIVRGLAPGYSALPQGFFISDIHGEMDEGEDAFGDDENVDDGGNNGGGNSGNETNCLQNVPTPEPAPNQTLSVCTSTSELYGTVQLGGHDVGLYGATCPVIAPSVTSLSLGVRRDSSVAGYYVGICGNRGSCTSRHVKPGDQILPPSSPTSLMINSDRNRYTVSVFAHDECDNLSDSLTVQFDYIGNDCNPHQDGSACGGICDKCCNNSQRCDFSCLDPNCGECKIDPPVGDRTEPGTCW